MLESETTLAHRMEMHSFAAESRAGLARSTGESSKIDTKEVSALLSHLDLRAMFYISTLPSVCTDHHFKSESSNGWHQ